MTIRPVDLIREEIGDLAAYLRNLPLSLRDSPYGQVYQQRLTALTDELAQVELARLAAEINYDTPRAGHPPRHRTTTRLITMKTLDDYTTLGAIVLVLLLMAAIAWWWLPQKWQACERLYDNNPAQVFCLLASK